MAKTTDTRVPKKVLDLLKKDYLEDDEEIIQIIHEAYVPRIDFRWLILTNERVVIAIRNLIQVHFLSISLDGITTRLTRGVFYDALEVQQMVNKYRATMYTFDRPYTIDFMHQIREALERFEERKQKGMSEVSLQPVQTLENLIELRKKGEITDKEYKKLKKEIIENIKKE